LLQDGNNAAQDKSEILRAMLYAINNVFPDEEDKPTNFAKK
jgi:hypothetical protein